MVVNDTVTAEKILTENGYLIKTIDVVGVKIEESEEAECVLAKAGFKLITDADISKL